MVLALGVALASSVTAGAASGGASLEQGFRAPPQAAKPWVYWFWSDGNITKEGITADLEAMHRAGIGGVLIMEVDQGVPKGPARFMGPAWRELFQFMLAEAKRLGIEVNMNNDAGWCGSGGPWNTAAESMQKVVWTETFVRGPKRIDQPLTRPQAFDDYYEDIAVLAYPSLAGEGEGLATAQPQITSSLARGFNGAALTDGDPATAVVFPPPKAESPQYVDFQFATPYAATRLELAIPVAARQGYTGQLQASADGTRWRKVASFNQQNGGTVFFPEVKSKRYRVLFSAITENTLDHLRLSDVELDAGYRIENFAAKSGMGMASFQKELPAAPAGSVVDPKAIVELTGQFRQGRLTWDVPPGRWTILRMGHTSTGKDNHPAPEEGRGLECDKLSRQGIASQFEGLIEKLVRDSSPEVAGAMTYTHIDSWEVGFQNWTRAMRDEFGRRRGYELFPFLPALAGRVITSAEVSERFLWDFRRTISEMLNDYYAQGLRELAAAHGIKLSIEAYSGGPFNSLSYSGRSDMPIGEFWTGRPIHASLKTMASGGHIYGNPIIGAEAFTASNADGRQKNHPGNIKALGDEAFANGINRFIFHRYSLQPWVDPVRAPGMTMGPWGLEYERTATWWEQSQAWHTYLARCQYMLQQGTFQADLCYLESEEGYVGIRSREQMEPAVPEGYDYDTCPAELALDRMEVKQGRISLAQGTEYRLLVLPTDRLMTPKLLANIKSMVEAGASVYGEPPLGSPSLVDYPACDDELARLAAAVWGSNSGTQQGHALGRGRVYSGQPLEQVLEAMAVGPDVMFQCDDAAAQFHAIHRKAGDAHYYFVASAADHPTVCTASFRLEGVRPELWHPETGLCEPAAVYRAEAGRVRVPMRLDAAGSVFVVFRPEHRESNGMAPAPLVRVSREGKTLIDTAWKDRPAAGDAAAAIDTFTMAAWVTPQAAVALPPEQAGGIPSLHGNHNFLLYPAPGHEVYARPPQRYAPDEACAGISVGTNGVVVLVHGESLFAPVLVAPMAISAPVHVAVVYDRGVPSLYVDGRFINRGLKADRRVRTSVGVKHGRRVAAFQGQRSEVLGENRALGAAEIAALAKRARQQSSAGSLAAWPSWDSSAASGDHGGWTAWVTAPGSYTAVTADGREWSARAQVAPARAIEGPWQVSFPRNWGGPGTIALEKLASWSEHADDAVKYFSGTAQYARTLDIPGEWLGAGHRLWLDLGDVEVSARVRLNGNDVGIAWCRPYQLEITRFARPGANDLEIEVANLWINRLIGDERLPEDSVWKEEPRGRGQVLAEYPAWLNEAQPSPTGRVTFKTWKHYTKDDPLVPSGLLGPVRLVPMTAIRFR